MQIIDQHCSIENDKLAPGDVKSEYDFLYLPMDFRYEFLLSRASEDLFVITDLSVTLLCFVLHRTGCNKGFAFVNLTTPEAARRLHDHLHRHRWKVNGSGKTCEIDEADRKVGFFDRPLPPSHQMPRCLTCANVIVSVRLVELQGLNEMVKELSDSRFDCGEEEFLPVWFEPPRDGTRTPVPHLVGRMLRC